MQRGYIFAQSQYDNQLPYEPKYIICDECQQEIYDGETAFEWEGKTICADCLEAKWEDLTLSEKANLLGAEERTIRRREHSTATIF